MRRAAAFLLLLATGCGTGTAPTAVPGTAASPARYTASGTVLEDGRHGPQLCMGVAESLPPQCEGADIVGWDWSVVRHESLSGVKWGEYMVVGIWDGTRLTLTEPPKARERSTAAGDPSFTSPCPVPADGWKPVDPARATQKSSEAAMRVAQRSPQYAGAWLDPAEHVLNFKFTGDLPGNERRLRKVWGGALCVSPAEHTEAELLAVQEKVHKEVPGVQGSFVDAVANRVEVTVFAVTDELQRDLDARYGTGTVHASGFLQPV